MPVDALAVRAGVDEGEASAGPTFRSRSVLMFTCASAAARRCNTSRRDISSVNITVRLPPRIEAYRIVSAATVDLPIDGRPPTTISCPGANVPSRAARSRYGGTTPASSAGGFSHSSSRATMSETTSPAFSSAVRAASSMSLRTASTAVSASSCQAGLSVIFRAVVHALWMRRRRASSEMRRAW